MQPSVFPPLFCTACARPVEPGHRHVGGDGSWRLLRRVVHAVGLDVDGHPLPDLVDGWAHPVARRFEHRINDPFGMADPVDAARAWATARFTGDVRVAVVLVQEWRAPLAGMSFSAGPVLERIERGDIPGPDYRVTESETGLHLVGGDGTLARPAFPDYPAARAAAERLSRGES